MDATGSEDAIHSIYICEGRGQNNEGLIIRAKLVSVTKQNSYFYSEYVTIKYKIYPPIFELLKLELIGFMKCRM